MASLPFLPEQDYDYVIIGTGLVETVLAGALASIGKSVVHYDAAPYYGKSWASLPLRDFITWASGEPATELVVHDPSEEQLTAATGSGSHTLRGVYQSSGERRKRSGLSAAELIWTDDAARAAYLEQSRGFAFDLSPSLVWARGRFVEDLIRSRVSKYLEFKAVEGLTVAAAGAPAPAEGDDAVPFVSVPCSRSDIFATSFLSPLEKRALMKFLKPLLAADIDPLSASAAADADADSERAELDSWAPRPLGEYLAAKGLSAKLQALVWETIVLEPTAGAASAVTCEAGFARIRRHLASIGRYGRTAFLTLLYGVGETVQAFARMAAVLGAIYVLGRTAQSVAIAGGAASGVLCTAGQFVRAKTIVAAGDELPADWSEAAAPRVRYAHAVVVASGQLMPETALGLHVVSAGAHGNTGAVWVFQGGASVETAPAPLSMYHLRMLQDGDDARTARQALEALVERLFNATAGAAPAEGQRPVVTAVAYYTQTRGAMRRTASTPENVHVVAEGAVEIDAAMEEAARLFAALCPGEVFLPPMPAPEEVVWPGEDDGGAEPEAVAGDPAAEPVDGAVAETVGEAAVEPAGEAVQSD